MMAAPSRREEPVEKTLEDIFPINSDSESDLDNNPVVRTARDSTEVANHDRELLDEEEERENLLTANRNGSAKASTGFVSRGRDNKTLNEKGTKGRARRGKRRKRRGKGMTKDEDGELMFEMEEGGIRSDVSSQASSSSVDLDKLNFQKRPAIRRRRNTQCIIITVSITLLFVVLIFGAYKVSRVADSPSTVPLLSNGSSMFAPTTILISLDGFRADFLQRGVTPTLNQFITEGVSPRWMLPSFPSVTFPNHYTLVTGLYPESHGIVSNTFWDPNTDEEFDYGDPAKSMQPKWWAQGEPIWVTAEKQNVKTAIHMWPGSEAGMAFEATYLDKFNGSEVLPRKTERILELLDKPSIAKGIASRPQLIQVYVPDVDANGHKFGPNSTEVWDTISDADKMLHNIFMGLDERNLTSIVNVVVVSDHGMASTSTNRTIQLDDIIDMNLIAHTDGWPHYGLRPKDPVDIRGLYDRLSVEAESSGGFDVYLRDENMPERYHFSKNDRIAPLWVVPKTGWAIVQKDEFDVEEAKASGKIYHPKGIHGYDHEHPLMRAIFIARGPAFPHPQNSRVDVFQNIEVYNIICDSIGITPKPSNGTLRLPLKPIGLHSDEPPPASLDDLDAQRPSSSSSDTQNEDTPKDEEKQEQEGALDSGTGEEDWIAANDNVSDEQMDDFWTYMKAKLAAAAEWAHNTVSSVFGGDGKRPVDPEKYPE